MESRLPSTPTFEQTPLFSSSKPSPNEHSHSSRSPSDSPYNTRYSGSSRHHGSKRVKPSLTLVATQRLGSLKWLMAKDPPAACGNGLGPMLSPPATARTGSSASGTVYPSSSSFYPSARPSRDPVRRSASEDIDRPRATSGGVSMAAGMFSSSSGVLTQGRGRGGELSTESARQGYVRPRSQGASMRRAAFAKSTYRISIDLEKATPGNNGVWVKQRSSAKQTVRMSRSSSAQDSEDELSAQQRLTDAEAAEGPGTDSDGDLLDTNTHCTTQNWRRIVASSFTAGTLCIAAVTACWLFLLGGLAQIAVGACLAISVVVVVFLWLTGRACCVVFHKGNPMAVDDDNTQEDVREECKQEPGNGLLGGESSADYGALERGGADESRNRRS